MTWVKLEDVKAWYEAALIEEENNGWPGDSVPGWKERVYIGFLLDRINQLEQELKNK